MSVKPSLNMLLDFAQKKSDASAIKLVQLTTQLNAATEKLNLLLQYRDNYQSRFQNDSQQSIRHHEWINFIAFMEKLDAAITEQRKNVLATQTNKDAVVKEYQDYQRKVKSYHTLSQRYLRIETQQAMKHDQTEQDEFAANISFHQKAKHNA